MALDDNQPIDDAPWCSGYDTTVYGCFGDADTPGLGTRVRRQLPPINRNEVLTGNN